MRSVPAETTHAVGRFCRKYSILSCGSSETRSGRCGALDTAQHVALAAMERLAAQDAVDPTVGLPGLAARPTIMGRLLAARLTIAKYLPSSLS